MALGMFSKLAGEISGMVSPPLREHASAGLTTNQPAAVTVQGQRMVNESNYSFFGGALAT